MDGGSRFGFAKDPEDRSITLDRDYSADAEGHLVLGYWKGNMRHGLFQPDPQVREAPS